MSLSTCERLSQESGETSLNKSGSMGLSSLSSLPPISMIYAPHPFFNARNLLEQQTLTSFIKTLNSLAGPLKGRQKPPQLVRFTTQTTVGQALRVRRKGWEGADSTSACEGVRCMCSSRAGWRCLWVGRGRLFPASPQCMGRIHGSQVPSGRTRAPEF